MHRAADGPVDGQTDHVADFDSRPRVDQPFRLHFPPHGSFSGGRSAPSGCGRHDEKSRSPHRGRSFSIGGDHVRPCAWSRNRLPTLS